MTLAFDPSAGQIAVMITHAVPDPAAHYIRDVEIRLNNVIVADPAALCSNVAGLATMRLLVSRTQPTVWLCRSQST